MTKEHDAFCVVSILCSKRTISMPSFTSGLHFFPNHFYRVLHATGTQICLSISELGDADLIRACFWLPRGRQNVGMGERQFARQVHPGSTMTVALAV